MIEVASIMVKNADTTACLQAVDDKAVSVQVWDKIDGGFNRPIVMSRAALLALHKAIAQVLGVPQ